MEIPTSPLYAAERLHGQALWKCRVQRAALKDQTVGTKRES
jgi:hypothetical protein